MTSARFAIRYSTFNRIVLGLMGMGPARSGVWVSPETVRVAMGWAFRAEFPVRAVVTVEPGTRAAWEGWGVHGWRGNRIANGSSAGLVRIVLSPESQARVLGFHLRLSTLRVSVTDPAALTALLVPSER